MTREVVRLIAHAVTDSAAPAGPAPDAAGSHAPGPQGSPPRPRIFLHIGEPKTGTTFLQQVMWRNRAELAARGVVLPGHHPQDHFRASQDLRGIAKLASDPAGSWTGEWEILASQARQAGQVAVISHELFAAADEEQAGRAVRSLLPAEVHIVLTVRDIATLLPAEWQETVKHRNARGWEDWLGDVIDRESPDPGRRWWWFWRVHDTMAILDIWSRHLPPERVHVITTPPRGSDSGLLWQRFASLLGIDPGSADLTRARPNTSLGVPEIEFLRRLNQALPDEVPDWFYMWNVKEAVAHQALAARPREGRIVLPASRDTWAKGRAEELIAALGDSGYDLVGDVDELRPRPDTEPYASPAGQPGRAGARRRRGRRGGAGGQPVPQGLPRGQAAAGPRRAAGAGRPGRGDRRVLAAAQADGTRAQQPLPGRPPAAHRGLARARARPGPRGAPSRARPVTASRTAGTSLACAKDRIRGRPGAIRPP